MHRRPDESFGITQRSMSATRLISYIWLIYLPFNLVPYVPPKSQADWLWIGISAIFLASYIASTERSSMWKWSIPVELATAGAFILFQSNAYMLLFPGWQISAMLARRPRQRFVLFCVGYYAFLVGGIIEFVMSIPDFGAANAQNAGNYMPLFLAAMAPPLSRTLTLAGIQRAQLAQSNQRLESIIRAERERIARDLHDTLGQSFSMITIKAELAQRLLTKQPEQVAGELEDIAAASRRNLQLVRDIVGNLRQKGIADVLVEEEKNLHEAGIDVVTQGEQAASAWPTLVQAGLGAVVQEACTNVIRHAHAHSVVIAFAEVNGMYTVSVQDDGNGKPPYDRGESNGIAGMRERIAGQGGRFAIRNNDIGTLVTACVPYERPHEEPREETA